MTTPLETPRLLLRPLQRALISRKAPSRGLIRMTARFTFFRDVALPAMERDEIRAWTLRLTSDQGNLIGHISFATSADNNRGFWISPQWRRQGLVTEAVVAVTDFWFNTLGFPLLRVPKAIPNIGPRRISETTGMRLVATAERDYVSGRFPSEIREITAEEWKAYRGAGGKVS